MRKIVVSLLFVVALIVSGCAKKRVVGEMLFRGSIGSNIKASDVLKEYFYKVKNCMGITADIEFPVVEIYDGNGVMCNGMVLSGCTMTDGTIRLPVNTDNFVIMHEFVHYFLLKTTGDVDRYHTSEWFNKCAGIVIKNDIEG